jgi:hypothetical protein
MLVVRFRSSWRYVQQMAAVSGSGIAQAFFFVFIFHNKKINFYNDIDLFLRISNCFG